MFGSGPAQARVIVERARAVTGSRRSGPAERQCHFRLLKGSLALAGSLWPASFQVIDSFQGTRRSQLPDVDQRPLACERGPCGCVVFASRCTVVFALRHFGEDAGLMDYYWRGQHRR
jgi:hypothetical protein